MRSDAIGFFWEDLPAVKAPKKEVEKRKPPERTWERDDYLPGLAAAMQFNVDAFNNETIFMAYLKQESLVFDMEVYVNFVQIAFKSIESGKVIDFCMGEGFPIDLQPLKWIVDHFLLVGFNSMTYDLTMLALVLAGKSCEEVKAASDMLIMEEARSQDVLKRFKVKGIRDSVNHIDLIEVAPLRGSLKIYSGRLHAPRMQDLPFAHYKRLSGAQMAIVRWYCINDLNNTIILAQALLEQSKLRLALTNETGIDLRSRSDAQIAEAVIAQDIERLSGKRPQCPVIEVGTTYYFQPPAYLRYQTPLMQWAFNRILNTQFVVSEEGNIGMPPELKEMSLTIGNGVYRMGIGGLHSSEQSISYYADDEYEICDLDVESFYPRIILNEKLFPKHLGVDFLTVYNRIVERRLQAKRAGNKVVSDSLKITINGSFGKLGSKFSVLYAPDLLIQTTITGQLSLLMLIEAFELAGITVMSANTDGIIMRFKRKDRPLFEAVVKWWERATNFKTEETQYRSVHSRDVNNYIAVKPDGGTKTKGAFANPWASEKNKEERLKKNPTSQVCIDAVTAYLIAKTSVERTIKECMDFTKFVSVRNVKGGAVKVYDETRADYLGKSIRWYYANDVPGELVYAMSGKKVPRSDGAAPCMELPASFPTNIDYDRYIAEAFNVLKGIGIEM